MDNRKITLVKPQHPHSTSSISRYFDFLMKMTYEHPSLTASLIDAAGVAGLVLASSSLVFAPLGRALPIVSGAALSAAAVTTRFMQRNWHGMPAAHHEESYQADAYVYGTAKAEMIVQEGHIPHLRIRADKHYDAGYAEGYILGAAIKESLEKTAFLYPLLCLKLGAPVDTTNLMDYLTPVSKAIPKKYMQEMHGKVAGYNNWLSEYYPDAKRLDFAKYFIYQLMPDLHNYNPFTHNKLSTRLFGAPQTMACTTISIRLGKFTFGLRILDWPSYDIAAKYFLQVERCIKGYNSAIDMGFPLLSGGLTLVNEKGCFFEMNISHSAEELDKPQQVKGMPAVFLNRECAENAGDVAGVETKLKDVQPLGAYHLTVIDGETAQAFHFYQSKLEQGKHDFERLGTDTKKPQLMVTANEGVTYSSGKPEVTNHKDSLERKANVHQLFSQPDNQRLLQQFIDLQDKDLPSPEDIRFIKRFMLELGRVAIVNNCNSVLCEELVYFEGKLEDISAATANLYAPKTKLEDFKQLTNPRFH